MAKTTSKITFKQFTDNISKGQIGAHKPGKIATSDETRQSLRVNPHMSARAAAYLSNLEASGLEDEQEVEVPVMRPTRPVPPNPENLPAIISKAVGREFTDPKWHMVKHLPGYMSSAIRALGRQVFAQFTSTPIEEIQVLSSMTNSETELLKMGGWIKHNGVRDSRMSMQFERLFPDYEAKIDVWRTNGYTFVVVVDFAGKYIYGWPTSTDKLR